MTRIQLDDNMMTIVQKMSEGNPGAVSVLMSILARGSSIDPDGALGGMGAVLSLDTHGIYRDRIWMLFKNVAGEDLEATLGVLRSVQLGILSDAEMQAAIDGAGSLDLTSVRTRLSERLPNFVWADSEEVAVLAALEAPAKDTGEAPPW